MSRFNLVPLAAALALVACSDHDPITRAVDGDSPPATTSTATTSAAARERLASRLAVALADPALRADFARRFAESDAPEGKLQFQALTRADGNRLLTTLATRGGGSIREMLDDLTAARDLEVYLPVEAHRAAWNGGEEYLVATLERDGEQPTAFDRNGTRSRLSATTPPAVPVIALVPQEHDFDAPRQPSFATCYEDCGGNGGGGSAGGAAPGAKGLYLTAINFNETFESWLKGAPEFEFHVYGEIDNKPEQLTCTGERASHGYHWNADQTTWRGSVALFTEADINHYLGRNPKGIVRIVAWEDDDKPCVPVANGPMIIDLVKMLDGVYKGFTAVKTDPSWLKGVRGAAAAFGLAEALRNFIAGHDDFIGLGIERSIVGWAPGTGNLVLKGEGAVTNGDFETVYRK